MLDICAVCVGYVWDLCEVFVCGLCWKYVRFVWDMCGYVGSLWESACGYVRSVCGLCEVCGIGSVWCYIGSM